jgi:cellulose synthase operon protein C
VVALELKPERGVDVRFSARSLDGYRPRGVVRSASIAREDIDVQQLAALEKNKDLHTLVGAHALKGEVESAIDQAGKLPESAATLSDLAALALLEADPQKVQANAERALSLAARARGREPGFEPAMWNEAVALERLRLTLAAAAAFDEIAARGGGGWPAEAKERAARLRRDYGGDLARWKELEGAADGMERGGAVLSSEYAKRSPSVARKALHVAIAAAADGARLDALAPLAAALELTPELARVRASDLARREPIAGRFAAALAKPDPPELRAVRLQAHKAGVEDIARAVALAIRDHELAEVDVAELESLPAAGPWWRLVAVERLTYFLSYHPRSYAEADLMARDVVEACRTGGRERDAYWCPRILRTVAAGNAEIGRVDRAYDLLDEARRFADETGDRKEEASVFSVIGQIAATRVVDWIEPSVVSDAYLREADLRRSHCWSRLFRLDFPARAALDHHRLAEAGRLLADADRINQSQCKDGRYNAEEVRLRLLLQRPAAAGLGELERSLQRIEESYAPLEPELRLYSQYLLARARLAVEGDAQIGALEAVIASARSLPDRGYPHKIRVGGSSALAEHAARRGAADRALASIAARMGVELEDGCAVGINHDDRVTVVVRGADGSTEATVREVPEGRRVLGAEELLSAPARLRLAGCSRIDVLATGPYFGVPSLLGPELRWAYRSSPRRRTAPLRLADQVVVTDVQAPPDLRLPALRRMELGTARTLEGAMATPEGVLHAIADAELVVINAHGITDANEPSAASLVLSPDPKLKGSYWLTAEQVRHARLSRSPVVILAACHAGRVQVSTEPWSLASSFLAAGARAVIAPTTEIPDKDANEVFESIVRRMQSGSSPEQAVAQEREDRGGRSPWLASVVVFQ